MSLPERVQLIDVGPRDGLQNEKQPVPAAVKIELVHRLQDAGLIDLADNLEAFGLVVTSYPYGAQVLEILKESELPLLVLSDSLSDTLLSRLKKIRNSCCMVKPLDYDKFNSFVRQTLTEVTN